MRKNLFRKYLILEIILSGYIGLWNATLPLLITKNGDISDLIVYEVALTIAAIFAAPILAVETEYIDRTTVLRIGCIIILITALFRYVHLASSYSIIILIGIDICAACAFAAIQPLLGIYPTETVEQKDVSNAYRIQRIFATINKVLAPLVAAALITVFSLISTLLASAVFGILAVVIAFTIKKRQIQQKVQTQTTVREKLSNILFGLHLKVVLPPERFLTVVNFALNLAVASTVSIIVPSLIRQSHLSDSTAGLANAAFALGTVMSLIIITPWVSNGKSIRTKYILLWCILLIALCTLTSATDQKTVAASCLFIGGLSGSLAFIGLGKRSLSVPVNTRMRLMAANIVVSQMSSSIAFLTSGFIIDKYGFMALQILYCSVAIFCIVYAMCANKVWVFLNVKNEDLSKYYETEYPLIASHMFK